MEWTEKDYRNPAYRAARKEAMARSGGRCQFCGREDADVTKRIRDDVAAEDIQSGDLTALCNICNEMSMTIRRFKGDKFHLLSEFKRAVHDTYDGTSEDVRRTKGREFTEPPSSSTQPLRLPKRSRKRASRVDDSDRQNAGPVNRVRLGSNRRTK